MSDEKKLAGRVALVTGAGKRLGRAVALRLANEGADVAVHYGKSEAEAREVVAEIEKLGRRAGAFTAELTDVAAIQKLMQSVTSRFGGLDILMNSAANFLETKFGETNEETWDASLDTNLKAPFFCTQAAAPHLAKSERGVIINFADIGGLLGWNEFLPHSVSKAGVIMMTRILAKELASGRAGECDCAGDDHDAGGSAGVGGGFCAARADEEDRKAGGDCGRGDVPGCGGVCDRAGFGGGWGKDALGETGVDSLQPTANSSELAAYGLLLAA